MNHMLHTALALAEKGLHVFPCAVRDKTPATTNGYKDASADPEVIRRWWWQEYNIGVATGAVSGVVVIDVDGLDAEAALRALEAEHGALPVTVEAITARGRHLYFKAPGVPVPNSIGKIGPGLDVRADGGYVVAPPSIHPSGKQYAWSVDTARAFARLPDWLLSKIGARRRGSRTTPEEWRHLARGGVEEGQRNQAIARLAGHLLRRHVDPFVTLEIVTVWNAARCRPPLNDAEVLTIVNSVAGRELKRRGGGD